MRDRNRRDRLLQPPEENERAAAEGDKRRCAEHDRGAQRDERGHEQPIGRVRQKRQHRDAGCGEAERIEPPHPVGRGAIDNAPRNHREADRERDLDGPHGNAIDERFAGEPVFALDEAIARNGQKRRDDGAQRSADDARVGEPTRGRAIAEGGGFKT